LKLRLLLFTIVTIYLSMKFRRNLKRRNRS